MPSEREEIEAEWGRLGPVAALQAIAKVMAPPLFWHDPNLPIGSRVAHNGTATLVSTGEVRLAVTAGHVYTQYLKDKAANASIKCQLGASLFDPEQALVDFDARMDLATFRLSEVPPGCGVHELPVRWPPAPPAAGSRIMVGGHPGVFRSEGSDAMEGGFATFFTRVHGAGPTSISCRLGISHGIPWPDETEIAPGTHVGGASGGPVLTVRERPVVTWCLSGIIVESHDEMELLIARPLGLIDERGNLRRGIV